jgi:hypothetical protein
MNRQDALDLMLAGIVTDMTDLYSRSGVSEEDTKMHLEQGNESFKLLCINMYERLLEKGVIQNA